MHLLGVIYRKEQWMEQQVGYDKPFRVLDGFTSKYFYLEAFKVKMSDLKIGLHKGHPLW